MVHCTNAVFETLLLALDVIGKTGTNFTNFKTTFALKLQIFFK